MQLPLNQSATSTDTLISPGTPEEPHVLGEPDFISLLSDPDSLQLMLLACPDSVLVTDRHGQIVLYTGASEQIFGFAPIEVLNQPADRLFLDDDYARLRTNLERTGYAVNVELMSHRKDAEPFATAVSAAILRDRYGDETGTILYVRDYTTVRSIEDALRRNNDQLNELVEQLDHTARHDQLTGLLYRGSAIEAAEMALLSSGVHGMRLGVAVFDLDHFKSVNDSYGHLVGDEVLATLAGLLSSSARQGDIIGRFGGEEFVAFLPGATLTDITGFAERVRHAFGDARLRVGPHLRLSVTVSAGVAAVPACADSLEEAIRIADDRLFIAKRAGRNRVVSSNDAQERSAA
jgi:diguanylate cyclase (GGDEF)-like protein/PAS domain S-box-containing protein